MAKPILGLSHDTCRWCGGVFKIKNDRRLYHHGHPARRCSGAGEYGVKCYEFMLPYLKKQLEEQLAKLGVEHGG